MDSAINTQNKKNSAVSPWKIAWKRFLKNKLAIYSLAFLLLVTSLCILAPLITFHDPMTLNMDKIYQPPSSEHWLGTEKGGRDVWARLWYGGQVTLKIGYSIMILVVFTGTVIGTLAGYFGKRVDRVLMRLTDFFLALPFLIFVIVLNTLFDEAKISVLILAITLLSWGGTARLVRGRVLSEVENEYILSAKSIGSRSPQIILKHILPNIISIVIVQSVFVLASNISVESSLSFIGFGVPAGTPSWGSLMSDAVSLQVIQDQWWIWLPAGCLVTLTILAINFIGQGLRQAFNVKEG